MRPSPTILGLIATLSLWGCASVLDEDGALAIAPYEIEESGRIVVEARINNQGPFDFAIDTASSISIVFDELRDYLQLDPVPGKQVVIHGAVASERFPVLSIGRLQVGREIWADARAASMPSETEATASIDGILGVDFLRRYAVGFSTKDRVIRLYPPELVGRRSYRGWASVPLQGEPIGNSGASLYFFEIKIDGKRTTALFDLGAGWNVMNWPAAHALGLSATRHREDELWSGAIESTAVSSRHNAQEVTTAGIRWQNEEFLIADLQIFATLMRSERPTAILGAGLFTQRDFIIDFVQSRILVKVAAE